MALAGLILALAGVLAMSPRPAAPFPTIVTDAATVVDVAPGIAYGDYEMRTNDGPLSIHVVAVDLHDPAVRIGTALAHERLVSQGETLSSMARRTGAVAGINGDYFDINQTNQPLNILVENSQLVRMPMQRWAIAFDKDDNPAFAQFDIAQTALLPQGTLPLKTMNDWPPPGGGAVLITPRYGPLRPVPNVTELALQPSDGTPPFATYRVSAIADNTLPQQAGYYLAIGPNAYDVVPLPALGDPVTISGTSVPTLNGIAWAIGGGPLLVKDGAWYADPSGPSKGEFATHMPASAVGVTRSGMLLLFEIDGRQPSLSIGVLQPQLASLMIAFGTVTGMQFDGGGSSTLVARMPGDDVAQVQNSPSDGTERRIADALLVYSDAPYGPPARISSMPQGVRAMPRARVPVRVAITDAGGHPARNCCAVTMQVVPGAAGRMDGMTFVAGAHPANAQIRVHAGSLYARIPVNVTTTAAFVQILPQNPTLPVGGTLKLQARAFDPHGYPIALPSTLPWATNSGRIDADGLLHAGDRNAAVQVALGDAQARANVIVGEHAVAFPLQRYAAFATAPGGRPGGIDAGAPCPACTTLRYDFTGDERAAYARASIPLPQRALGIDADVYGDGNGEILRIAVDNAIHERFLYTVATIDWRGRRHVEFRFPSALPQPITFKALYVINRVGPSRPVHAAGSVAFAHVRILLAGRLDDAPK